MKDSFLVVGTDQAVLKTVLTRWDGKHDRVLAENDVYRYIVDKCRDFLHKPNRKWATQSFRTTKRSARKLYAHWKPDLPCATNSSSACGDDECH